MDGCTKEPDQEGDEEASADPDVKDRRVAKLGDVATDPVVQHEHVENGEEGEGASGIDGHDREVQRGVGGEDDQEGGQEVLQHLAWPLPEENSEYRLYLSVPPCQLDADDEAWLIYVVLLHVEVVVEGDLVFEHAWPDCSAPCVQLMVKL